MTPATAPGSWQALHIHYAANPRPLMNECVTPLVERLTADGLLENHFFINYWLEGPHVRLRLKPSSQQAAPEVLHRAETAVAAFLRERPALYEVDSSGFLNDFYNTLFDLEFPEEERAAYLGPDGRMKLRPNNSFFRMPYEPEYGKYGGPAGVGLAEWHFRHSSELVMAAVRGMNLHLRTVRLGTAAQLMMVMAGCFLPDRERLAQYLDRYHAFWHRAFSGTGLIGTDEYERACASTGTGPALSRRFAAVLDALAAGEHERLPGFLRGWAGHCTQLRERAAGLAVRGELVFRSWDGARDETVTDPAEALPLLLSPYMHMTNNRLHVTIRDEAYLSYALGRALRAPDAAAPGDEP
ncbi:lantibiotic dehydratase C-terminal domain-containing protein [Streptomyces gamaensis]|uniref:Lantibiotic dehydratase C-terminal domain-containing protein n=1 Tax=Streptomyces gamaensis TaxID=1763542 RepID=A0ABW0Z0F7_9ACTN